jgi:hypothetical protein
MRQRILLAEKQCWGKVCHATYESARNHKKALGYEGMDIYRCCFCGGIHVGHGAKRKRAYKRVKYPTWMLACGV